MINILEYLENSAEKYPDKIAVEEQSLVITYADFLKSCKSVGSELARNAVNKEPIAVYMEKGIDALCAFFGGVYAGAFYSHISPELPPARIKQMQSVLGAGTVITSAELYSKAEELFPGAAVYRIDALKNSQIDNSLLSEIREKSIDVDPLYLNFTSGTTGVPKGIVVSHRSVIDFIHYFTDIFQIRENDVLANQAPFDFDVSVKDIYSAISTGAKLVIVPRELFSIPQKLIDYLCEKGITTMIWAVSALCLISAFHGLEYRVPETVKKVLFSGETMPYKHLQNWKKHLPEAQFVNLYGPTEITCNCTYHILDADRDYENGIPIGKPFPNEDVFLLNENDERITQPGVTGEIVVRGTALALGYYYQRDENEKRFTENPLNPAFHDTIYRTGDSGCYNPEHELMFCGRKDHQIKHMGHRIELDEIEKGISAIHGVERCACIFDKEKSRLKGFYVGTIDKTALIAELKKNLPVFMIPGYIRKLEMLPLNKNGKIDRNALSAL